jgi:hypothetical protein
MTMRREQRERQRCVHACSVPQVSDGGTQAREREREVESLKKQIQNFQLLMINSTNVDDKRVRPLPGIERAVH